ncbi:MAG: SDR family oxidoreductase [Rhodobacteraceae bacterium]|jgi:NAD(P)-dependent dehydrogenase (short-subunit alcohol dehydrogenase family)|nr:SDR family oxidoreductase [Paracoccaceae bacterium]
MSLLAGRVAIVTGAGRGIGAAAAAALAAAGARVAVAARDPAAGTAQAERIVAAGGEAMGLGCDVADPQAAGTAVAAVRDRWGRIDILINNAGVIDPIARIAEADPEAWARTVAVNLVGAFRMAREVLPAMLAGGGGTIVAIGSGAALRPMEGWSAYCASKAGLLMLARSLDHEYRDHGIRSLAFAPGIVDTGMQGEIRASGLNPVSRLPRTALAPADDPARALVWLCGPGADAHLGAQADIRDPALRAAAGLAPLPG